MTKPNSWNDTNEIDEPNWDKWILIFIFIAIFYGLKSDESKIENSPKSLISIGKNHPTQLQLKKLLTSTTLSPVDLSKILLYACKSGFLDIVKLSLSIGADIDALGRSNETPLFIAMENKQSKIVAELLKHNPNFRVKTKGGHTILHWASKYNYIEVARKCLLAKVNINETSKVAYWTALHYAARGGHRKIIALLKENGANTNLKLVYGDQAAKMVMRRFSAIATYIERPLNIASILPSEKLITKYSFPKDAELLFKAIQNNEISIIDTAIKENRISTESSDQFGRTMLAFALQQKRPLITALLASSNANLFATDIFDNSILHWAVMRSDQWLIKNIIQNRENVNLQNVRGDTPLYIAVRNNDLQAVTTLLENGADPSIRNLQDKSVYDLLQNASKNIQTLLANMAESGPSKALKINNAEVEIKDTGNN